MSVRQPPIGRVGGAMARHPKFLLSLQPLLGGDQSDLVDGWPSALSSTSCVCNIGDADKETTGGPRASIDCARLGLTMLQLPMLRTGCKCRFRHTLQRLSLPRSTTYHPSSPVFQRALHPPLTLTFRPDLGRATLRTLVAAAVPTHPTYADHLAQQYPQC